MAVIPEHETPKTKQDCIDTWRNSGRIGVPSKKRGVIDLLIVSLYETTSVNGMPLDALIEAQVAINVPTKQFGVLFGDTPPDWPRYKPLPVLWVSGEGVGRWKHGG